MYYMYYMYHQAAE